MFEFIYQYDEDTPKINMITKNKDVSLYQVCESFEDFLRGCGYFFDGHVTILNEKNEEKN